MGGVPHQEGEGGGPPKQERTPFVRSLIQEMWGSLQDLRISTPTVIRSRGGGGGKKRGTARSRCRRGSTSLIRG